MYKALGFALLLLALTGGCALRPDTTSLTAQTSDTDVAPQPTLEISPDATVARPTPTMTPRSSPTPALTETPAATPTPEATKVPGPEQLTTEQVEKLKNKLGPMYYFDPQTKQPAIYDKEDMDFKVTIWHEDGTVDMLITKKDGTIIGFSDEMSVDYPGTSGLFSLNDRSTTSIFPIEIYTQYKDLILKEAAVSGHNVVFGFVHGEQNIVYTGALDWAVADSAQYNKDIVGLVDGDKMFEMAWIKSFAIEMGISADDLRKKLESGEKVVVHLNKSDVDWELNKGVQIVFSTDHELGGDLAEKAEILDDGRLRIKLFPAGFYRFSKKDMPDYANRGINDFFGEEISQPASLCMYLATNPVLPGGMIQDPLYEFLVDPQ